MEWIHVISIHWFDDPSWWFPPKKIGNRQPLRHSEAQPIRYCPPHFLSPILSPPKKRRDFFQWWRIAAPLMGFFETKNFRCSLNSWLEYPEYGWFLPGKMWMFYGYVSLREGNKKKKREKNWRKKKQGSFKNRWYLIQFLLVWCQKKRLQTSNVNWGYLLPFHPLSWWKRKMRHVKQK